MRWVLAWGLILVCAVSARPAGASNYGFKLAIHVEMDEFRNTGPLDYEQLQRWFLDVQHAPFLFVAIPYQHRNDSLNVGASTCILKARVDEYLNFLRAPPADPASSFYAHGLILPYLGYKVDPSDVECSDWDGMIWFLGPTGNPDFRRETFAVFDRQFHDCADFSGTCLSHADCPGSTCIVDRPARQYTVTHELLHVLNADHCEIWEDGGFKDFNSVFGSNLKSHLIRTRYDVDHVRPGGDLWCDRSDASLTFHENQLPHETGCQCDSSTGTQHDSEEITLTVEPEKQVYLPGEPIHVNVSLRTSRSDGFVHVLPEKFLHPSTGYLTFEVGDSAESLEVLRYPLLAEGPFELAPLEPDRSVERRGIDIWFNLERRWFGREARRLRDRKLWIRANYVVWIADGDTPDGELRPVRIVSDPIDVTLGPIRGRPELYDPEAHDLFTHWESRRFLWLGGGEHLPTGIAYLERIVEEYENTLYAAYAEMALGGRLMEEQLQPPKRKKGRIRKLRWNPARPDQALAYFDKAESHIKFLPPSYQRRLTRWLERAREETEGERRETSPAPAP